MKRDRSGELRAVGIVFLVIPLTTVLARCYVRIYIVKKFAVDDWLAVVTMVFLAVYALLFIASASTGIGGHGATLTIFRPIVSMKIWYCGELIFILTGTLMRITVGAFLLRIAFRKIHRDIVYGLLAANVVFGLFYFIFAIFQCTPIRGFWTRIIGEQVNCRSAVVIHATLASSGLSTIIDCVFGVLPAFILWKLNVPTKKKIGLAVVMGLGVLAATGPLVRIPYLVSLSSTRDFFYDIVDIDIWSFVEPGLGLTVICVLTLRPLFVKLFDGTRSMVKYDTMSIGTMPTRSVPVLDPYHRSSHHVSVQGGRDNKEPRCTPFGDDDPVPAGDQGEYDKGTRMTYETSSVTEVDVVDDASSRLTLPGAGPTRAIDYV